MSAEVVKEQVIENIIASLSEPLPESVIKQRVGWIGPNGEEQWIDYIDWHTAADLLDRVCPDWSYEVRDINLIGELVAVTAAITIKGVTRCGVGVGPALEEKGIKGAEHDALKRAAIKFGIARSLYKRDRRKRNLSETKERNHADAPGVTEKQLSAIYAIAKAKSLDAYLESKALFKLEPEELSRPAASDLIDHLRNIRIRA